MISQGYEERAQGGAVAGKADELSARFCKLREE